MEEVAPKGIPWVVRMIYHRLVVPRLVAFVESALVIPKQLAMAGVMSVEGVLWNLILRRLAEDGRVVVAY